MLIKSIVTFLLVLLFAVSVFSQSKPTAIQWQTNYKTALKLAQKSGKPVLIKFNAEWCLNCDTMEKTLWSKPEISQLAEEFVTVSVDYARDRETVARFGVSSIPHVIVADSWGNMLDFHHGYDKRATETAIHQMMKNVWKDFSEIQAPNLKLETKKDNAAALVKIAEFYRKINALFLSNKYFKQALKTRQLKSDAALQEKVMIAAGENYLKLKDYDEAESFFKDSLLEFPKGEHAETAFFGLITINIRRGRIVEAETAFSQMKTKFPDSQVTQQAAQNLQEAKTQLN
ncbi:MAG: thioredoxin family protein [Acidobacteriota bacterium]|nr:thioredoxin family protein [Acidobacteriota bacterium]